MKCLICGKEIPADESIDDCVIMSGISEDGTWWEGYGFICSLFPCFMEFKKRLFKDKKGTETVFIQN